MAFSENMAALRYFHPSNFEKKDDQKVPAVAAELKDTDKFFSSKAIVLHLYGIGQLFYPFIQLGPGQVLQQKPPLIKSPPTRG
ncbi:MAG: hypothetical protein KGS72_16470 [Cyanobacteria bacterium REEB67]|nr:hypothetical protein [Cyanobacteria bacterium REEB67]